MNVRSSFILICVIALLALAATVPHIPPSIPLSSWFSSLKLHYGLDLDGGTHLVYEADVSKLTKEEASSALEGVRDVIEHRVNGLGVSEPIVQTNKSGDHFRLIVELAGIKDVNQAIKSIGETPLLEFKEELAPAPQTNQDQKATDEYNVQAQAKAFDLNKKLLLDPSKFAEYAQQYSDDTASKDTGGEIPFAKREQLVKEFSDALFDTLKVGQITITPVKTVFGYHIIQKEEEKDVQDGTGKTVKEVRSRHILIATHDANVAPQVDWRVTPLTGKQLEKAEVRFNQQSGVPEVNLTFNAEGKKLFESITETNVGKRVGIFLDGALISSPTVQQKIIGGNAVITGNFTIQDAKQLVERLNAGSLPVPISLVSQQTIGPSLGKTERDKSLKAGLIGLIAVALFMIAYYRLPGLVAVFALALYALIAVALFKLIPITLTLAGITGFILSIGMAVDANVLIFERLKEELAKGDTLMKALQESFIRAWTSIRDSNISSLISAGILIWFGSGIIKGFAITLTIGILVSMFTAITTSRTFLLLVAGVTHWKKLWLWNKPKV